MSSEPTAPAAPNPLLLRLIDRTNPILVRVVRQELRNRAFISIFLLLLAGAAIAAMVVAAVTRDGRSEEISRGLFGTIAFGWSFALWLAQPLSCFRAISNERNDDTWDLLELTGLRPLRVVGGLLLASLVQGLLYTSALAPFMVMAYLLRGIDLMLVLFALAIVPLGSVAASAVAVFAACLGPNKASRGALGGLLGLGLVGGWLSSAGLWFNLHELNGFLIDLRSGAEYAWAVTILILNIWLAGVALLLVLSSALLAFRAANRSTGPRLMWWILWLNGWCWTLTPLILSNASGVEHWLEAQVVFGCFGVFAAGILGLFSTTEDEELSPRQARSITGATSWWKSRVMVLFGPGAARGRLCFLAMGVASLAISTVAWLYLGAPGAPEYSYAVSIRSFLLVGWGAFVWFCIVFMVSDWLYRGWLADWFPTPGLRRGFSLLVLAVWCLLPWIGLWILDLHETDLVLTSPISTLILLGATNPDNSWGSVAIFSLVGVVAIVALLLKGLRLKIVTQRIQARDEDRNPRGG